MPTKERLSDEEIADIMGKRKKALDAQRKLMLEDNANVIDMKKRGLSLRQIAVKTGVGYERVRTILKHYREAKMAAGRGPKGRLSSQKVMD